MDIVFTHPLPFFALLLLIFALHVLEARAQKKGRFAALGFLAHLGMIAFLLCFGAGLETLLFVLLLSAAVALA